MRGLLLPWLILASGCVRFATGGAPAGERTDAVRDRPSLDATRELAATEAAPDRARSDAAASDATRDASKPDLRKPDAAKPDAVKPDAAKPDLPGKLDGLGDCTAASYLGHPYLFCKVAIGWEKAEAICVARGRHLVTVDDALENQWLLSTATSLFGTADYFWLGANDLASEGSWVWSSGTALSYTKWGPGEPNNSNNEDCAELRLTNFSGLKPGDWNDSACTDPKYFICE